MSKLLGLLRQIAKLNISRGEGQEALNLFSAAKFMQMPIFQVHLTVSTNYYPDILSLGLRCYVKWSIYLASVPNDILVPKLNRHTYLKTDVPTPFINLVQ